MSAERFGIFSETPEGRKTITYTRELAYEVEKVWRAITDDEERGHWFPELSLEPVLQGKVVMDFSGGDCPPPEENPEDIDYGHVSAWEPPHLFEFSSLTAGEMRFEISATDAGCTLMVLVTLPADQHIQNSVACGWHYKIDAMEWRLNGEDFELEGFAGPTLTELYFGYRSRPLA